MVVMPHGSAVDIFLIFYVGFENNKSFDHFFSFIDPLSLYIIPKVKRTTVVRSYLVQYYR
jgi:hypothetical protein